MDAIPELEDFLAVLMGPAGCHEVPVTLERTLSLHGEVKAHDEWAGVWRMRDHRWEPVEPWSGRPASSPLVGRWSFEEFEDELKQFAMLRFTPTYTVSVGEGTRDWELAVEGSASRRLRWRPGVGAGELQLRTVTEVGDPNAVEIDVDLDPDGFPRRQVLERPQQKLLNGWTYEVDEAWSFGSPTACVEPLRHPPVPPRPSSVGVDTVLAALRGPGCFRTTVRLDDGPATLAVGREEGWSNLAFTPLVPPLAGPAAWHDGAPSGVVVTGDRVSFELPGPVAVTGSWREGRLREVDVRSGDTTQRLLLGDDGYPRREEVTLHRADFRGERVHVRTFGEPSSCVRDDTASQSVSPAWSPPVVAPAEGAGHGRLRAPHGMPGLVGARPRGPWAVRSCHDLVGPARPGRRPLVRRRPSADRVLEPSVGGGVAPRSTWRRQPARVRPSAPRGAGHLVAHLASHHPRRRSVCSNALLLRRTTTLGRPPPPHAVRGAGPDWRGRVLGLVVEPPGGLVREAGVGPWRDRELDLRRCGPVPRGASRSPRQPPPAGEPATHGGGGAGGAAGTTDLLVDDPGLGVRSADRGAVRRWEVLAGAVARAFVVAVGLAAAAVR